MLKALEKTHQQAAPEASSFLSDQVAALLGYDPGVRAGERDASSEMNAAAGRVLSVLGDRRLFDRTSVDGLRGELAWLSEALGPLCQSAPVHDQNRSNAQGPAYEAAYDRALAALESDRYFRMVADLQQFCSAPPVRQPRRSHLYGRHLYRG